MRQQCPNICIYAHTIFRNHTKHDWQGVKRVTYFRQRKICTILIDGLEPERLPHLIVVQKLGDTLFLY